MLLTVVSGWDTETSPRRERDFPLRKVNLREAKFWRMVASSTTRLSHSTLLAPICTGLSGVYVRETAGKSARPGVYPPGSPVVVSKTGRVFQSCFRSGRIEHLFGEMLRFHEETQNRATYWGISGCRYLHISRGGILDVFRVVIRTYK